MSVGSPNVGSLTNTMMFHDQQRPTSREQQSDIYCIPSPGLLGNKQDAKTVIRSLETPTYDVQLSNLSSNATNTNKIQQQQSTNRQQQSPEFQQAVNQMAERMQAMAMVTPSGQSPGNMMPSPTQQSQQQQISSRSINRPDLWFKQVPPPQVVPQSIEALQQQQQQQLRQRNSFTSNLPIQQPRPFNSLAMPPPPDVQLHAQNHLVKSAPGVQPQHTYIAQNFSAQPSNFGVIGQNIRPPGLQVAGNPVFQANFQAPTIPLMQRSWSAAAPPGIPDPMGEARRVRFRHCV